MEWLRVILDLVTSDKGVATCWSANAVSLLILVLLRVRHTLEHASIMMGLSGNLVYLLRLDNHAISVFYLGEILLLLLLSMLLDLCIPIVKGVHSSIGTAGYASGTICNPLALIHSLVTLRILNLITKCNHFTVFETF